MYKLKYKICIITIVFIGFVYLNTIVIDVPPQKLDHQILDIQLKFEGIVVKNIGQIYQENLRYYIPINYFVTSEKGSISINSENTKVSIVIGENQLELDAYSMMAIKNGTNIPLVDEIKIKDGLIYTNLSNLAFLFDYVVCFDYDQKSISLHKNKSIITPVPKKESATHALLRLEDITFSGLQTGANLNRLVKLRTIADLLYEKNIPFHIAWIPRYIHQDNRIDNDLLGA